MTITKRTARNGIVVADVLISDLQDGPSEIDIVDPGAAVMLQNYINVARQLIAIEGNRKGTRWRAARALLAHSKAAFEYLEKGDAEGATWNALVAAGQAWLIDVKGLEPHVVADVKSKRTHKRAADATNLKMQAHNAPRDQKIERAARQRIQSRDSTPRTVSEDLVRDGQAGGLSVASIRRILRKAGIR